MSWYIYKEQKYEISLSDQVWPNEDISLFSFRSKFPVN